MSEESLSFDLNVSGESQMPDATTMIEELDFEEDSRDPTSTENGTVDVASLPTESSPVTKDAQEQVGGGVDAAEKIDVEDGEIPDADTENYLRRYSCRFYQQGSCSWGTKCRFLHLSDKGLYSMFDSPTLPTHASPAVRRPQCTCLMSAAAGTHEAAETAWDRALREAVECVKQWDAVKQECAKLCVTLEKDDEEERTPSEPPLKTREKKCESPTRTKSTTVRGSSRRSAAVEKSRCRDVETAERKSLTGGGRTRTVYHSAWRRSQTTRKRPSSQSTSSDSSTSKSVCRSRSSFRGWPRKRARFSNSKCPLVVDRSCHSKRRRSWSRHSARRTRRSPSTSDSSSSSSPVISVSKRVSIRFDKKVPPRREEFGVGPKRGATDLCCVVRRREDLRPSELAFVRKRPAPLGLTPVRGGSRSKEVARRRRHTSEERVGCSLSDSTTHRWTPKTTGPLDSSCSDMSISPQSDSSLSELFEPTRDRLSPLGSFRRRRNGISATPRKANREVQLEVYGPVHPKETREVVRAGAAPCLKLTQNPDGVQKQVARKTMDPLERELMKFHRRLAQGPGPKSSSSSKPETATELPRGKIPASSDVCAAKKEEPVRRKIPSKKEVLLRRLQEINAAIERRRGNNWPT